MPNVPKNVHTVDVPDSLKSVAKQLARDKRREAKERAQHERDMKKAAKTVVTGR